MRKRQLDKSTDLELLKIPEIRDALELLEESAYTPGELESYSKYWDSVSTEKTMMNEKYREGEKELQEHHKKMKSLLFQSNVEEDVDDYCEKIIKKGNTADLNRILKCLRYEFRCVSCMKLLNWSEIFYQSAQYNRRKIFDFL